MLAYIRWLLLGCCLLATLAGFGMEYVGKVAFLNAGALWVQQLPDGVAQKVASGHVWGPRFSNSGRWLLYRNDDTLKSVEVADLGNPQVQSHRLYGEALQWSPTADILAYTRGYTGIYLTRAGVWRETTVHPAVRNTTEMEAVFPGSVQDLAWSPDGKRLAYIIMRKTPRVYPHNNWGVSGEIHLVNADGRGDRLLWRDTPYGRNPLNVSWTPDGRYLLYYREADQSASILAGGTPLYALPVAGGKPVLITNSTFSYLDAFAVSPDGRQLAISEGHGEEAWANRQMILATLPTGSRAPLTKLDSIAISPAWSPQDGLLAYVTAPAGPVNETQWRRIEPWLAQRRIVLQRLPAGTIQPFTGDTSHREEYPQWSADGNQLLFVRITSAGQGSLWTRNLQTDQSHALVEAITSNEKEHANWDGFYGSIQWTDILNFWRGQRLDVPAREANGTLFAPVHELITALGGTVSATAPRECTITLDGISLNYVTAVVTDPQRANDFLWQQSGVTYCSLSKLAQDFSLQLSWNAPAAEAVVNDTRGSRIVIVPSK